MKIYLNFLEILQTCFWWEPLSHFCSGCSSLRNVINVRMFLSFLWKYNERPETFLDLTLASVSLHKTSHEYNLSWTNMSCKMDHDLEFWNRLGSCSPVEWVCDFLRDSSLDPVKTDRKKCEIYKKSSLAFFLCDNLPSQGVHWWSLTLLIGRDSYSFGLQNFFLLWLY